MEPSENVQACNGIALLFNKQRLFFLTLLSYLPFTVRYVGSESKYVIQMAFELRRVRQNY
jgi:hypothetical protein